MRKWISVAAAGSTLAALVMACSGEVLLGGLAGSSSGQGASSAVDGGDQGSSTGAIAMDAAFGDGNPCVSIEQQSLAIRQQSCALCHEATSGTRAACVCTLNDILDDQFLLTMVSPDYIAPDGGNMAYLTPGDPDASLIYVRTANGQMPPPLAFTEAIVGPEAGAALVYPSVEDVSLLNEWITSCLGPGPSESVPDATIASDGAPSGSSGTNDATSTPDSPAGTALDVTPPSPGEAGFAFVVNGVVQVPMSCPSEHWEFPAPAQLPSWTSEGNVAVCDEPPAAPCPGVTSVVIANTGQVPLAYFASSTFAAPTIPGVLQGDAEPELVGVLDPGGQVDISSVFVGGVVAVLGSSEPFSTTYASDEGVIPWPGGVAGSMGSAQMYVAEIEIVSSCHVASQPWL